MTLAYHSFPIPRPPTAAEVLRVETTTLLPGGGVVVVAVRRVGESFDIGDEACGRTTLLDLGIIDLTKGDQRRGREIAARHGLRFDGQAFQITGVSLDQLSAAIVYVAEACRAWTDAAVEARERRRENDLADVAYRRLIDALPGVQIDRERELQGNSTKRHRFDLVAVLPGDRLAMFETTAPAASSIAPTHLKFFDLSRAHPEWPREAVIADYDAWAAPDLAILQQVSTHVRAANQPWTDLGVLLQ